MPHATSAVPKPPATNILKCRDDPKPVEFVLDGEAPAGTPQFMLNEHSACSWAKSGEQFGPDRLRPRIEPWLTALCQSEHISLLIGSGLPNAVYRLACGESLPGMTTADFGVHNRAIEAEAARSAAASGRNNGNIEDQLRSAHELLRGQEIRGLIDSEAESEASAIRGTIEAVLADFADSVRKGEYGLATAPIAQRENAFNYLVSFLMSFASRAGTRERLHIFTTNYDRFVEAGAEAAGLYLLDRFVGSLAPVFRSSRLSVDVHYNPPGIRGEPRYLEGVARFTKLHGSLDWFDCERTIRRFAVPFGAASMTPFFESVPNGPLAARQLMIYPNAAKDRETAAYPYVELFRDFAAAACRPNHTLVTFGYGFGDDHLNRVIEDMLTIPSAHLVIVSHSDPLGRILRTYEHLGRHAQITLLVGDHVGEFQTLVDNYLPKPAIDRTTFRMSELLKSRWGTSHSETAPAHSPPSEDAS
ncbi:MAG: fibronectin-binding protein (FBP) [Planctomycetota bacterium]|nr:MAG: fibronectin-binding protein (FBP) [Planctomycetota bacterium]